MQAAPSSFPSGRCLIIRSPFFPEKFPLTDNLPVKIRSVRAAVGRGGFLSVKMSAEGEFSGGGRSYNRYTFYGVGDILIMRRLTNSVIISFRADFSWGEILMWHRPSATSGDRRRRPPCKRYKIIGASERRGCCDEWTWRSCHPGCGGWALY